MVDAQGRMIVGQYWENVVRIQGELGTINSITVLLPLSLFLPDIAKDGTPQ